MSLHVAVVANVRYLAGIRHLHGAIRGGDPHYALHDGNGGHCIATIDIELGSSGKLFIMAGLMAVATSISMLAQENFNAYFADALSFMMYMLVPWSAINLADYYVVRKGRYDIADMFRIDGQYGAYRWKTIGVYVLGIAVQLPFMSLSFYKGPVAQWLGADLAWLPGLLIPGVLHVIVASGDPSEREGPSS